MIIYSTCSILVEENEDVVAYALRKRHVKLVETGLEFGEDGFTSFTRSKYVPQMKLCKRYYPHTNNLDGFFVAKLVKIANGKKETAEKEKEPTVKVEDSEDSGDDSGSDGQGASTRKKASKGPKKLKNKQTKKQKQAQYTAKSKKGRTPKRK